MPEDMSVETTGARLAALEEFATALAARLTIGSLAWTDPPPARALCLNNCIRRQRDTVTGAIALGAAEQGHLSVAFIRTLLEERVWMKFLGRMNPQDADDLLLTLGRWDVVRSLVAQRDYIGDRDMTLHLWYPPGFVDAQAAGLDAIKADLGRLRSRWGWQGTLPSTAWVADQVSLRNEYDYLHSATSRAVHFSAGEAIRRGWGTPDGILITNKPQFRAHLANFAFDQIWRLHLDTILDSEAVLLEANVRTDPAFASEPIQDQLTSRLKALGRVPMVHAHEWNLAPPPPGTLAAWFAVLSSSSPSTES